jgi:phosphoribosylformimino-5-aminoimidazole carboxamide ribotide isomerase
MRLIPVIDIQAGNAVHARSGDRRHYRPISSALHPGSDPRDVARALRDRVRHADLYLADLDSIAGRHPNRVVTQIVEDGGRIHLDPGIREAGDVEPWLAAGATRVILGTETCQGPEVLRAAAQRFGPDRVALGLDLRSGRPMLAPASEVGWGVAGETALGLLHEAVACGIRAVVVLELKRVGRGRGLAEWAVPLALQCRQLFPELDLWVGGGLAGDSELPELAESGISGALVATALHENRIGRSALERWRPSEELPGCHA